MRPLVGGIVVCGGKSTRMGLPKAWLPFGDELMLSRVVRILGSAVDPVVVVAAVNQALPPLSPSVEVVRDDKPDRGPLQGLAAGLRALTGRVEAVFLSSCDVPFLSAPFVHRMVQLLGEQRICIPHVDGFHHPLAAVYRIDVLAEVERLLQENRLRPLDLLATQPTRVVTAEELRDADPGLKSLRNLNTLEDYEAALRER